MRTIERGTIIGFLALIFATMFLVSAAGAAEWRVAKVSGEAYVPTNGSVQRISLGRGNRLASGTVKTGANGRVLLVRGRETMLVGPNSTVDVPKSSGASTTIFQRAGQLVIDVEKRNVRHFTVQTPYLAAVVKGTRFTVTVTRTGARVDVHRGAVEVADRKRNRTVVVRSGQSASTARGGGLEVSEGVGTSGENGNGNAGGNVNSNVGGNAGGNVGGNGNSGNGNSGNGNSGNGNSGNGNGNSGNGNGKK